MGSDLKQNMKRSKNYQKHRAEYGKLFCAEYSREIVQYEKIKLLHATPVSHVVLQILMIQFFE
jgi:hypothetical protein